jgi:hypothetical protein
MMALTIPPGEPDREPIDDYHVQPHVGEATRPARHHVIAVINGLLLIILAAVSFALFWIVATLLGLI